MNEGIQRIGCILMASGLSQRYGKNKLLELLDGREIILHTADRLIEAGLQPLTVTRSPDVKVLLDREGIACVLHDGPLKSDTIHRGLENLPPDLAEVALLRCRRIRRVSSLCRRISRWYVLRRCEGWRYSSFAIPGELFGCALARRREAR